MRCCKIQVIKLFYLPLDELHHYIQVLRLSEYIMLINFLFVKNILSSNTIEIFQNLFSLPEKHHEYLIPHGPSGSAIVCKS